MNNDEMFANIMAAARSGDKALMSTLLEKGIDPDIQDKSGVTALMLVSYGGYEDIGQNIAREGCNSRYTR